MDITLFGHHPVVEWAAYTMQQEFAKKRAAGTLSLAHDEQHVLNVANYAGVIAGAITEGLMQAGFMPNRAPEDAQVSAALAGILHDICREANEKTPHGELGYEWMISHESIMQSMGADKGVRSSATTAVRFHEDKFKGLHKMFGKNIVPSGLSEIVATAIVLADGAMEASGYRVLERRCFFVGRERIIGPKNDLGFGRNQKMSEPFHFPGHSYLAVLGETLRRLYGKLPIDEYPVWFKSTGEELHGVQYLFLAGLLAMADEDEHEAVDEMARRGFPSFEGIPEKVHAQRHLSGQYFSYEKYLILSSAIENAKHIDGAELADATRKVVMCLACSPTPDEGIAWLKEAADSEANPVLQLFARGIVAAQKPDENTLAQLHDNVAKAVAEAAKA